MVLAAIPARWGANRFPGKPIADIAGRPMIAWIVEVASRAASIDHVAVITDDERIARAAENAGARAIVSLRKAASGSDRIGHLLKLDERASGARVVVNLQADEPLLEPSVVDALVAALDDPAIDIATPVRGLREGEAADDPHLVKAVTRTTGDALYFSRAAVPAGGDPLIHVGVYGYQRAAFDRFISAEVTSLERVERLEQLRALEIGLRIRCVQVETRATAVDTPEDAVRVAALLAR